MVRVREVRGRVDVVARDLAEAAGALDEVRREVERDRAVVVFRDRVDGPEVCFVGMVAPFGI